MAVAAKKKEDTRTPSETVHAKMETLARFVLQMADEEIWAFLDSLFPRMTEEEKEDLFDSIIMLQRKEIVDAKPAADVFAEIERSKGISS